MTIRAAWSRYGEQGLVALDDVSAEWRLLEARPGCATISSAALAALTSPSCSIRPGTTGAPKGIPLRHRNVVGGVANALAGGYFRPHERLFAYLPTAWVGDFVFTVGGGVLLQATVNIPGGRETALHDLREVAPTFYLAAPRAWDNMLTRVQVGMCGFDAAEAPAVRFLHAARDRLERRKLAGGAPSLGDRRVVQALGEILVYGPIKDYLGLSRAERATGGEAMGEDTFLFFRGLGIHLKQFYGQTETSALSGRADRGACQAAYGRPGHARRRAEDRRYGRNPHSLPASVIDGLFRRCRRNRQGRSSTAGCAPATPAISNDGSLVVLGRVSEVVRTRDRRRHISHFIENRIRFFVLRPATSPYWARDVTN